MSEPPNGVPEEQAVERPGIAEPLNATDGGNDPTSHNPWAGVVKGHPTHSNPWLQYTLQVPANPFVKTYLEAFNKHLGTPTEIGSGVLVQLLARIQRLTEEQKLLDKIRQDLEAEKTTRSQSEDQLVQESAAYKELQQIAELQFLHSRVTTEAHKALFAGSPLKRKFDDRKGCHAFVVSMDIRGSTELMLKARHPNLFADFMAGLSRELEEIIKSNLGVVDKFTGDGLLAFFPDFFSGSDAGFRAILAASQAHRAFRRHYTEHRNSFATVLKNAGMGIGIDAGTVHLMQPAGGLTVVGTAVVYACRMGGAPAGKTYMNQPAYEEIFQKYSAHCSCKETSLAVKNEDELIAYEVQMNDKFFLPSSPDWLGDDVEITTK